MPKTPKYISQTEYARHRGVTRQAVNEAIKQGRLRECIVKVKQGSKDIRKITSATAADAEWARNTITPDPVAATVNAKERREENAADYRAREISNAPMTEVRRRLEIERLHKQKLQNEALEREAQIERGEMILASKARRDISKLLATVRLRLRQVPTRLGQRFPGIDHEILHGVGEEIDDALTALANMG
jgi:phage terminase Nu1 subunit (DNA packaging protein)